MPVLFPDTKGRYSIENTALDIFGPGNRFTAARLVGSTSTYSPTLRPSGLRSRAAYRVYLRPSHRSHRVYAKRHRIKVRYSGVGKYISNRMPPVSSPTIAPVSKRPNVRGDKNADEKFGDWSAPGFSGNVLLKQRTFRVFGAFLRSVPAGAVYTAPTFFISSGSARREPARSGYRTTKSLFSRRS